MPSHAMHHTGLTRTRQIQSLSTTGMYVNLWFIVNKLTLKYEKYHMSTHQTMLHDIRRVKSLCLPVSLRRTMQLRV